MAESLFNEDDMWDDLTLLTEMDTINYGFRANHVAKVITIEIYDDEGNVVETKSFKLVEVPED